MRYTEPIIKYRRYTKMARGKRISLDEKIANVQAKVDDLTSKLANAKEELKELEAQKQTQDLKELRDLIYDSGMTIEEVKERLSK